eukprot:3936952-Rhodomonas_salina.2
MTRAKSDASAREKRTPTVIHQESGRGKLKRYRPMKSTSSSAIVWLEKAVRHSGAVSPLTSMIKSSGTVHAEQLPCGLQAVAQIRQAFPAQPKSVRMSSSRKKDSAALPSAAASCAFLCRRSQLSWTSVYGTSASGLDSVTSVTHSSYLDAPVDPMSDMHGGK